MDTHPDFSETSTLPKDVYLYITDFADDKTILNMLSVNKKFKDEKFFELVINKRYPLLIKFKRVDETWKKFYVRMIYYIALLEEKYGIPYIPTQGYNPEDFYRHSKNKNKKYIYDEATLIAARGGHLNIVKLMLQLGSTYKNGAMMVAAREGHKNIVEFMMQSGYLDLELAMTTAARAGHLDIVKLVKSYMDKQNYEYVDVAIEESISEAKQQEHPEIVEYLREQKKLL